MWLLDQTVFVKLISHISQNYSYNIKNNGHHLKLVWKNLPILSANCYNVTTFKVNRTFQDNFVYTDPMIGHCNDKNMF